MNKATFRYIQDPGHGWLEVPRQLLAKLGIEYDVTSYSYVKGQTAYLEENCDLPLFINAFKAQCADVELDLASVHVNNTPIRSYQPYPMTRPQVTA